MACCPYIVSMYGEGYVREERSTGWESCVQAIDGEILCRVSYHYSYTGKIMLSGQGGLLYKGEPRELNGVGSEHRYIKARRYTGILW